MRKRRRSGSVLLLATLTTSLLAGDVMGLAAQDPQPANPTPQTQPTETQTPKKRTSKKSSATKSTTTATGDQTTPATPADAMPAPGQQDPAQMPQTPEQTTTPAQTRASRMPTEQTDLSGTYAGTFTCDALGLSGDTTLTITGNQFTTADGKSGRIVASTTGGYTAVALQTGDVPTGTAAATGATAAPPTIVSLRARRSRNSLTLTPAAGSTMECRFTPSRGNVARGRRSRQRTPAATGTEVSNPAAMPSPTTTPTQPTPEQPTTPEQPMPSQTPSPSPTPSGSPTPMPSPTPSGSPTPMPSPSGSPTPEPSPTASPSPSPSPIPARPRG